MKTRLQTIAAKMKACKMNKIISLVPVAAGFIFLIMALTGCHGGHH